MATNSTKALADLVNKRFRCLTQLVELGRRQAALIDAGETSELLRLLAAKGQLIAALQAIETALAPFHSEDPETRQWESPAARAACAAEADRCRALLAQVMQLEAANEAAATQRRDAIVRELKSMGAASRARDAYRSAALPRTAESKIHVSPVAPPGAAPSAAGGLDVSSEV